MKKSIVFYFQVHQPTRLRLYRFFDIGKDSHYYDDFADRTILKRVVQKCYLPMNALLLDVIKSTKGAFKCAFSISGVGRLMLEAINLRDYPIIQGGVLFISISYCVINLAVDLLYGVVDPRIRVK